MNRLTQIEILAKTLKTSLSLEETVKRIKEMERMVLKLEDCFPGRGMTCPLVWFKTHFVQKYVSLPTVRLGKMFLYLSCNYKPFEGQFPIMADFENARQKTNGGIMNTWTEIKDDDYVKYSDPDVKALFKSIQKYYSTPASRLRKTKNLFRVEVPTEKK